MAGFPRRNNDISFEDLASVNGLALPSSMTEGYVSEPWMKEMLDENAINNTPLDWDIIDSYNFNNDISFDSNTNSSSAMHSTQEAPVMVNDWSNHTSGHLQTSTNMLPDRNATSFGQSDYQSTCPSLTPDTPFLDYSPSLDNFASFDATPTLPSPSTGDASQVVFDQVAAAFRDLARARAEADPRSLSRKQKQREASIALYLQRLRDTCNEACAMLGSDAPEQFPQQFDDSMNTSQQFNQDASFEPLMGFFQHSTAPIQSSVNRNCSNESSRPSPNAFAAPTMSSSGSPAPPKEARTATPVTGGVELVMDLNMNFATTMPRKHKPRTQAQRERYLAVRSHGACEKHKRQHKRCTCIDNMVDAALGKQEPNGVKRSRATRTSKSTRTTKEKTNPSRATPTPATTTQLQEAGHQSLAFCLNGCQGQCYCFTRDTDDLHWQFLQHSGEQQQQQQTTVRNQQHYSDGREVHANVNSRVGAPPPQSCSPQAKPPRASSNDNSPVTWDIAAVSRSDGLCTEIQQNGILQTISAQNTPPAQNRTSTISTSPDNHNHAASAAAAADGRQPVIGRTSDPGANPLRTTRTSALETSSTSRAGADYASLQPERGRHQVSQTQSSPSSASPSSSLSASRSDHGSNVDLRRDRNEISDLNAVSQLTPEHAPQMRQTRDPDAVISRNREIHSMEQRSAVHSGTLPPININMDSRYDHEQQDRNHALQFTEQRRPDYSTHVPRYDFSGRADTVISTRSQRHTGAITSLHTSDTSAAQDVQRPQCSPTPPAPAPSSAVATISSPRPTSASRSAFASLILSASSLSSILTTLASSTSISLSRALSSCNGGRAIARGLHKGHSHGSSPLESLGPWIFIWAICLFFSLLVHGSAAGAGNNVPIGAEKFLQRLV